MQGKTPTTCCSGRSLAGFNEAPAKCRGKLLPLLQSASADGVASMRPPRNAGENAAALSSRLHDAPASMRPPRNAGENLPNVVQRICTVELLQ